MSKDQNGPTTRAMAKKVAKKGGKHNLGYDEDGVDNAPWPLGSTGPMLRGITKMIERLEDESFKVTKRTPDYENPYVWDDGCCNHPLETKEEALAYWEQQLEYRKAEIEEARKNRKSDL